jgi:hypothetical protein
MVQLIHQTAREFLLAKECLAQPYNLDETYGDTEIAGTCCGYIRIVFMAAIPQTETNADFSQLETLTKHLSDYSLLEYAITTFATHIGLLGANCTEIRTEFENFIADLRKKNTSYSSLLLSQWVESLTWPTALHICAHESSGKRCLQSALTWAAGAGENRVVGVLLALGADINDALQAASAQGHKDVVLLLLNRGADVNAQGGEYVSALQAAAHGGHQEIVQLLLNAGADVNA